jgi:colanic acid biosynthesis protein WcaH
MNNRQAIEVLEKNVPNPSAGLPLEVFFYASRITPMVNVDLLIKDERGRTLLAWRNDPYAGRGWHLPGGVVRLRETLETRVRKVALTEIGAPVDFDQEPIAINQIIHGKKDRSHFISILYNCRLSSDFVPANKGLTKNDAGYLQWHRRCPHNLLKLQGIYKKFFKNK